ncbi:MAG: hypothetical protein ACKVQR_04755 [Aquabacterium sp.]
MNLHPALSMLATWLLCGLVFAVLPYESIERPMTPAGVSLFALFVAAFVTGSLMIPPGRARALPTCQVVDARLPLRLLATASVAASICLLLDAREKDLFDLVVAYELRSEAADALLKAEASLSSVFFQLAFLLYPAGFAYLAMHTLYAPKLSAARLLVYGFLPVLLATLVMGGRVPVFYGFLVMVVAWLARRSVDHPQDRGARPLAGRKIHPLALLAAFVAIAIMAAYFAAVFMVRAEVVGGAAGMFELAESQWGVGFRGPGSSILFALLGDEGTYLLFVFIWYLVQGLIMGQHLFSAYDGPAQLGIYGADLVSALMRRLDPARVADGFDHLLAMNIYGFLPSAWGSLWVDFGLAGLAFAFVWGVLAALVWRRCVRQRQPHWMVWMPFVSLGIVFSLINTPLGFTNGLVTHTWVLVAFLLLRVRPQPVPAPLALPVPAAASVPA